MAVGVALVGRLIGNADGEKRDHRRHEVEAGMERFGEDAQAAGTQDEKRLQRDEDDGRADAEQRRLFFLAHFAGKLVGHGRS